MCLQGQQRGFQYVGQGQRPGIAECTQFANAGEEAAQRFFKTGYFFKAKFGRGTAHFDFERGVTAP